ncbi:ABC transporter substrate-binding protein [Olsenella sp. HMSC062G07]|uniref:peptide ABC transporter substrate-binding protein n=1 Tax=Olsenella sp. HMSC062G07 TaxID=1739330 RepID=UPI0008A5DC3E|nr:ABC transporter substrate-binding protein [Olsenella sp. HMSC062G07]OFK23346.1 ABC transporter substrate-binding protein [Olsenella sp. HMSC062G07]
MHQNHAVTRRGFVAGGLASTALAALAGCGKKNAGSSDGGTGAGGTLKYYINNPVAIDPYNTQEDQGTQVEHILFDALTDYDWSKSAVVPKAAESWESNDDDTEFTFHLVKGAKFHNGDAVDAKAFKRGFERICDPDMSTPSEINYHLAPIVGYEEMLSKKAKELSGVTCPDENTLVIKLNAPMADFPTVCSHPALAPVPQAALDDPASFLKHPIGNGPFMMDGDWVADQYINVKRFDDYYGEKAKLDAINFSIQKDPDTAFREFEGGNLDMAQIPTGRFGEISEKYGKSEDGYTVTKGHQVLTGAELSVYYLAVNCEKITDATVRRAISLAINRQNICDTLFEGTRTPADSVFPKILDPDMDNSWPDCKYDKAAAQKLVDDNNLAGTEITLSYNSGGGHEDIMSIVQSDLEAVGFKVTQESQEWASYLTKLGDGNFQMGRLGWIADYPTMDNFIYPNFYSTADNNYSKYNNPAVDKAIDAARQITDEDKRKEAFRAINKTLGEDMPIIPLMFYSHNWVGSSRIEKLYLDPQSKVDFATASIQA